MQSKLLSRPLISLPKPTEFATRIEPSTAESIIFSAFEEVFARLNAEKDLAPNDPRGVFKGLFNQLTRLRQ